MFNGLPAVFDDKVQNTELFVQKRIYNSLQFLTMLPIEQNETGLFTNYIEGNTELCEPLYTNNGITFNEIKFGQGQTVGGQTLPIGFMYNANTRDKQRGTYESNLLSFYNEAVVKIADFYEDKYAKAIMAVGRQSEVQLADWDTAENIIDNEIENYKYKNNISRFKKGEKQKVIDDVESNNVDYKNLVELRDKVRGNVW